MIFNIIDNIFLHFFNINKTFQKLPQGKYVIITFYFFFKLTKVIKIILDILFFFVIHLIKICTHLLKAQVYHFFQIYEQTVQSSGNGKTQPLHYLVKDFFDELTVRVGIQSHFDVITPKLFVQRAHNVLAFLQSVKQLFSQRVQFFGSFGRNVAAKVNHTEKHYFVDVSCVLVLSLQNSQLESIVFPKRRFYSVEIGEMNLFEFVFHLVSEEKTIE